MLLALPPLLLALSIVIVLGVGTFHAAIAVGVTSIAKFARLTRAEVIRVGGRITSRQRSASAARSRPSSSATYSRTR